MYSSKHCKQKYLVMAAVIVVFIVYSLIKAGHYVTLNSPSDNEIRVEAKASAEGGGGVGYLTLADGEGLVITADLSEGSFLVEVFYNSGEEDAETEPIFTETFSSDDSSSYELEAGEYAIRVTAHEGATGTMTVLAE